MPEIFVYAAEGRTVEQKKALMKDLTDADIARVREQVTAAAAKLGATLRA